MNRRVHAGGKPRERRSASRIHDSFSINVAGLLQEPFGTTRMYDIRVGDGTQLDELDGPQPVRAVVRLTRTNRGIFAEATVTTGATLECARCLERIASTVEFEFSEEFCPTIDLVSGLPSDLTVDADTFRIDGNHQIDLSEAIRQYGLVNLPLRALCQPDCAGLCPECGINLNVGSCKHQRVPDNSGQRASLGALREWLRRNASESELPNVID